MDTSTLLPLIKKFKEGLNQDTFLVEHSQAHQRRSNNAKALFQVDALEKASRDNLVTFLRDTDAWYGVRSGEQFWDRLFGPSDERLPDVREALKQIVKEGELGLTPESITAVLDPLKGIGLAFLSEILCLRFPEKYWMWNGPVRKFFSKLKIKVKDELPWGKKGDEGEEYFIVGNHMHDLRRLLAEDIGNPVDFLLTDLFIYWSNQQRSITIIQPDPDPSTIFKGFSNETFQFMKELKANNSDGWMRDNNRANFYRYKNVVQSPLRALFTAIAPTIQEIDPGLETEAKVNRVMATIRKRFEDEEGPYQNHLWGAFYRKNRTKQTDSQLYISIYPDSLHIGFSVAGAQGLDILKNFQANLLAYPKVFFELLNRLPDGFIIGYSKKDQWIERSIGELKLDKDLPELVETDKLEILKKYPDNDPLLFRSSFTDVAIEHFRKLYPFYRFAIGSLDTIPGLISDDGGDEEENETYKIADLCKDTYLSEEFWIILNDLLKEKGQVIFFGPPGTGKTWVAEKYARYWVDQAAEPGGKVKIVQFHPSYSYEEFIEGIRPESVDGPDGLKQISYPVKPGIFRRFCEEASQNPNRRYVMIIDEINRGELPRILGELLYLLEYRNKSVELPYSGKHGEFGIPKNVYIIGTMNTADRSIALVDHALRRRFYFIPMKPDPEILRAYLQENNPVMVWVADLLEQLNTKLEEDAKIDWTLQIGHSHFMKKDLNDARLNLIWEYSIIPTLEEYFYRKDQKYLDSFRLETLREALGKR